MSGVHVAAERWIRPLPERRGDPLDAGCKEVLRVLWGCVDWSIEREPVGRERPWISREEIAAAIGSTVGAVADRVRKLTAAGWIRWDGRAWSLAWAEPWERLQSPGTTPVTGDSSDGERRLQRRREATPATASGDSSRSNQGNQELSQELRQSASVPDATGAGSPMQWSQSTQGNPRKVTNSPEVTHASPSTATSSPTAADPPVPVAVQIEPSSTHARLSADDPAPPSPPKPRRRKPKPPTAQANLGLGDTAVPDVAAKLIAEHERLHNAALVHHGERDPAWPGPSTNSAKAIAKGVRQALKQRGENWCRRMLAWRGEIWLEHAAQLQWSKSVWTKPSLEYAAKAMGGQARASRSMTPDPTREMPTFEY